jgi:beta-N-acetylhexosaminidase
MKWMIPIFLALAVPVPAAATPGCATVAQRQLAHLSIEDRVGQLVMAGGSLGAGTRRAVQELHVGLAGLPHMPDLPSAQAFTRSLGPNVMVGSDFEYGAAQQIDGTTAYPRSMGLGATNSPVMAAAAATGTAYELRQAGVLLSIAPVADVNSNPELPFGVRSFGEDPARVSAMTAAQIRAYRAAGIAPTVKHFPGLGGVNADPHLELPTVDAPRETFDRVHLPPFQAAIAAHTPALMTSHVIVKAIDPELPVTLSHKATTDLLRTELGYQGVVITDSIQMGAIQKHWGLAQAAVMAIQAGADVVLSTGPFSDHVTVVDALRTLPQARIDQSALRVLTMKCEYKGHGPALPVPAEPIARASITLLDNKSHALPFSRSAPVMVAGVIDVAPLAAAMNATAWQAATDNPTDAEIADAVSRAPEQVLVATYSRGATLPLGQARLVQALKATGKRVAAVSLGTPYDVNAYPDLGAALAAYAQTQVWGPPPPANKTVLSALAKVVFGARPGGRLPVTVSAKYPAGLGLSY